MERLNSLLPKWLESRGVTPQPTIPPSPQCGAVIPQKGGEAGKIQKGALDPGKRKDKKGKKVREEKRGQVAQPSQPLRYREARSAVRSGPLKGPPV